MYFTSNARTQGMTPKLVKANALLREVHRIVVTKGSLQTLLSFFIFYIGICADSHFGY